MAITEHFTFTLHLLLLQISKQN